MATRSRECWERRVIFKGSTNGEPQLGNEQQAVGRKWLRAGVMHNLALAREL